MKIFNYILEKNIGKGAFGEVCLTTVKGDSKKICNIKKKVLRLKAETLNI